MDQLKENVNKQAALLRCDGYLDAAKLLEGLYLMYTSTLRRVNLNRSLAEHYKSQLPQKPEEDANA